jgi:hypothetical protein
MDSQESFMITCSGCGKEISLEDALEIDELKYCSTECSEPITINGVRVKRFASLPVILGFRYVQINKGSFPRLSDLLGAPFLYGFEYDDGAILSVPTAYRNSDGQYSICGHVGGFTPVHCTAVLIEW